jgi:hypothetical protein
MLPKARLSLIKAVTRARVEAEADPGRTRRRTQRKKRSLMLRSSKMKLIAMTLIPKKMEGRLTKSQMFRAKTGA